MPRFKPQLRVEAKRAEALEMRKAGLTYREIGAKLSVTAKTAYDYVQTELLALREQTTMDAESLRDLDVERCDRMIAALWPKMKKDPATVTAAIIRVMERRSKLLGLDAPTKAEWSGVLTAVTAEQAAKMSESEIRDRVKQLLGKVVVETQKLGSGDPSGESSIVEVSVKPILGEVVEEGR